eukprot:jgi/Picre1/35800/NNA_003260.t1
MAIKKASLFMLTTPLLLGAANASGNMGGSPDWWQVDDASEGTEACVQVSYGPMGSFDPVTTQSGMRGSFSVAKKATQMYLADSMLQTEEDQEILSVCNANITDVMRTVVVTEACEQNGSEENKYVVESSFTVPCSEEDMAILPDGTELTRRILTNGSKNMSMKGMAQGPQIDRVEGVMELEEDDGKEEAKRKENGEKKRNATKKDGEKKRNATNNGQEGSSRKLLHNKNGEKKGQGDKNGEGDGEKKQYGKNGEKGGDGEQQGEKKQYGKNGEKKGDGDKIVMMMVRRNSTEKIMDRKAQAASFSTIRMERKRDKVTRMERVRERESSTERMERREEMVSSKARRNSTERIRNNRFNQNS